MTRVSYAGCSSSVINDNLGQDLVRAFVEARGTAGASVRRWREIRALLQSTRLRSELR